eukprot:1592204-Karenia_brevis.AAC.1
MGSPGGKSAFQCPSWKRHTTTTSLLYDPRYTQRSADQKFIALLNKLRLGQPKTRGGNFSVAQICAGHRAWPRFQQNPLPDDMRALFERFPTTVCLAVSRVGCQTVNDASLAA